VPCRYRVNRRFGGTYRLHLQGRKIPERGTSVSRWIQTDFSALKMNVIRSSETSVHRRYIRRHIPEDGILHSHRCENLKSYISGKFLFTRSSPIKLTNMIAFRLTVLVGLSCCETLDATKGNKSQFKDNSIIYAIHRTFESGIKFVHK
jgi:hypothetical protein